MPPGTAHWFGTTIRGRILAQTVAGAGPTVGLALLIGLGVTLLSVLIGIGAVFGGKIDQALSLLVNVFYVDSGRCHCDCAHGALTIWTG